MGRETNYEKPVIIRRVTGLVVVSLAGFANSGNVGGKDA